MPTPSKTHITEIKQIIKDVWAKDYNAVNYAMVEAYWLIGRRIKFPIRRSAIAIFGKKKVYSAITDRRIDENPLHPISLYSAHNAGS